MDFKLWTKTVGAYAVNRIFEICKTKDMDSKACGNDHLMLHECSNASDEKHVCTRDAGASQPTPLKEISSQDF